MDPLSITTSAVAIAAVLVNISQRLYAFVQNLDDTDNVIEQLRGQALGLISFFNAIAAALEQPLPKRVIDDNTHLWQHISYSIDGCQSTAMELVLKLNALESTHKNAFMKGIRQFRLGAMQGDINRLFASMQTHSINIQLSMSTVQVLISSSLPDIVAERLEGHLERLERQHDAIDRSLQHSAALEINYKSNRRSVLLDDNTRRLRDSAMSVIGATNAVITSKSTVRTYIDVDEPVFEDFDSYGAQIPAGLVTSPRRMESTTGSEYGTPLNAASQAHIQSWLQNTTPLDVIDESSSSRLSTYTGISSNEDARIAQNAQDSQSETFDESDDDELDLKVAEDLFKEATDSFNNGKYLLAEERYRNAFELEQVKHMSVKNSATFGLKDMKLNQAICLVRLKKIAPAEHILFGIIQDKIQIVFDGRRVNSAFHYLAALRLQQGNLAAALLCCQQARKGKSKYCALGKNDPDYFASVRLYALIRWAQGRQSEAKEYIKYLPLESKISSSEFDEILETEYFYKKPETTPPQIQTNNLRGLHEPSPLPDHKLSPAQLSPRSVEHQISPHSSPRFPQIERKPIGDTSSQNSSSLNVNDKDMILPYRRGSVATTLDSFDLRFESASDVGVRSPLEHKSVEANDSASNSIRARRTSEETLHSNRPILDPRTPSFNTASSHSPMPESPPFSPPPAPTGSDNMYGRDLPDFDSFYINPQSLKSTAIELQQAEYVLKQNGYKGKKLNQGLVWAAREGHIHAVNYVLQKPNIDPELRVTRFLMERQDTALHLAVRRGHINIAAILLPRYSSPDIIDAIGATPLRIAASEGDWRMCALLLHYRASVNGVKADWGKPLRTAAYNGKFETCALLVARGADINAQGGALLQSALMAAALAGHADICKFLCAKGANKGLVDREGCNAALVARKGGHMQIFNWLSNGPVGGV